MTQDKEFKQQYPITAYSVCGDHFLPKDHELRKYFFLGRWEYSDSEGNWCSSEETCLEMSDYYPTRLVRWNQSGEDIHYSDVFTFQSDRFRLKGEEEVVDFETFVKLFAKRADWETGFLWFDNDGEGDGIHFFFDVEVVKLRTSREWDVYYDEEGNKYSRYTDEERPDWFFAVEPIWRESE